MNGWSVPPSTFADLMDEEVGKRVRAIAMAMLGEVVLRSPVGNADLWKGKAPPGYVGGRFRGSHLVSIGQPDYAVTTEVDKAGSNTISKGSSKLSGLEPYTVVYIQSNLPYSERLENGHSTQAPDGIYDLAFIGVSEAYK